MNAVVSPNRNMLIATAQALRPLLPELVFVGGQIAELLVTDKVAPRIRETDDVDVIVKVTTYSQYGELGERLVKLGFIQDSRPGAPPCRWLTPSHELGRTKLDVMPTAETTIGPANPWYEIGMSTCQNFALTADLQIRILSAPAFLATKWAAYESRGRGDVLMSHDVEDVIAVVAARASLPHEIAASPKELREYLRGCTSKFLRNKDVDDALEDALPEARLNPGIVSRVRARLEEIASLS